MTDQQPIANSSSDAAQQLSSAISSVFAAESITTGLDGKGIRLVGQLLTDSDHAYRYIAARFRELGYTPVLREHGGQATITAIPGVFTAKPSRDYGAIVLFAATVASVLFAGGSTLARPLVGLPFAAGLLAILVAHELGHYFVARRLGVAASLPYFIPMPVSPFGTMGAVIRTRTPMQNRRQLLTVGAAGPVAGLIVAIPALVLGLLLSQVRSVPAGQPFFLEGNSLFYAGIKLLLFGQVLPKDGYDVFLHPLAFAAWAGLLVTSLNLIPAGQLDGGHIAYALLGRRARWLNRLAVVAALALGLVWSGWFLWAAILVFLGQRNAEPLDDITPLTEGQKAFALAMLVIFVLLFTPVPLSMATM